MSMENIATSWAPRLLSVLRAMSGLLLLQHGTAKILHIPAGATPPNFTLNSLPGYAGVIELACGVLIAIGLFTRPAAFLASGLMAAAYFMAHAPQGFFPILNKGELAALYCFVFLYLAAAGAGPWSVDAQRK